MDTTYLKAAVGDSLADALALLAVYQPADPIEWLSTYLHHECEKQVLDIKNLAAARRRDQLLEVDRKEQLERKQKEEEQERLASLRRPNAEQLECATYLNQANDVVQNGLAAGKPAEQIAAELMQFSIKEIVGLAERTSMRENSDTPPEDLQKLVRACLLACKYKPDQVETWDQIRALYLSGFGLRRFESLDVASMTSLEGLRAGLKSIDGVDYQARHVQKHPLGPLAVRFQGLMEAVIFHYASDIDQFKKEAEIIEDEETKKRKVWSTEADTVDSVIDGLIAADGAVKSGAGLSVLPGLDTLALEKSKLKGSVFAKLSWSSLAGEVDVDGSLIMLNGKGQPIDYIYHLVDSSKDSAHFARHCGDTGAEEGDNSEQFEINFNAAPKDVAAIAFVLNVATDGESLSGIDVASLNITNPSIKTTDSGGVEAGTGLCSFTIDCSLIDHHELLLGMAHRRKDDPHQWDIFAVGEQVKGPERDEIESQNFLNCLHLSQQYFSLLGFGEVDESEHKFIHPFKMKLGDVLEVPAAAMEDPIVVGMGWDVDEDVQMDLDCGIAIYSDGQRIDYCDFEKLVSNDQAIVHQGDNRDGEGDGDDESINIEFMKIDAATDVLFLYAAVYEGGALKDVQNVHIRMVAMKEGKLKEICRFSLDWLAEIEDDTAVILAKIMRVDGGRWEFRTIGTTARGRTIEELEGKLTEYLD